MIKSPVDHILDLNARGHTFVVIEHNMEVVMSLCRRIIVLSQGERIAEGTPAEVADNPLVLDAYFGGERDYARAFLALLGSVRGSATRMKYLSGYRYPSPLSSTTRT
jgi:energy-coupling factor transporter ATP-binding protein EcfA2